MYLIKHFQGQEKNWKCWLIFFLTVEVKESSSCGLLTQSIPPSTRRTEQFCFLLKLVWLLIVFQFAFIGTFTVIETRFVFYFFFQYSKELTRVFFQLGQRPSVKLKMGHRFIDWDELQIDRQSFNTTHG